MVEGKCRYASVKSLADAKLKEQELKTKTEAELKAAPEKTKTELTLDEVWGRFYADAVARLKAPEFYERRYRIYIKNKLGSLPMSEVSTQTMQELIQELAKVKVGESWSAKTKNKTLSYTTRNGVIKTLKRIFVFAQKNDLYSGKNHAENLELFSIDNWVENILNRDDFLRLMHTIKNWKNKMVSHALLFCLFSGKRAGEVFNLTWDRVDFESGNFVFLVKSKKKNKKQNYPMNDKLKTIVEMAREDYSGPKTNLVFPTKMGGRIFYGRSWTRIKKAASINSAFRVHDLRHTFATILASSGKITLRELQYLLGHSTITMTERYAHLFDNAIQKSSKVSGEVISEALNFDL